MGHRLANQRTSSISRDDRSLRSLMSSASSSCADSDIASMCTGMSSIPSTSTAPDDPNADDPIYPCELHEYLRCPERYSSGQEEAWFAHVADHMKQIFPVTSSCIFCEQTFVAESMDPAHRRVAFHQRMMHIARHFRRQRDEPYDHWNLDEPLLKHLLNHGIVDKSIAALAELAGMPRLVEETRDPQLIEMNSGTSAARATRNEEPEITQKYEFARGQRASRKRAVKQDSVLEFFV